MGTIPREIVEFDGIRTFLFPNIALYGNFNEELIKNRPDEANPVAAFVFGATKRVPEEQEIIDIILADNANPTTLSTGMDTCLALGGNFISHFKSLTNRLAAHKHSHDLSEVVESGDTKRLALIGRRARLQKGLAAKILWILVKIMMADDTSDDEAKFTAICELCPLDLDFDAYILIKMLGLESVENAEEVEIIKENVMEKIRPGLADLMRNGPLDELTRLLRLPIEESAQKLICHVVGLYKENSTSSEALESTEIEERRLASQIVFLLLRAVASDKCHVAQKMLAWIPMEIRRELFPGLQNNRIERTIDFVHRIFVNFSNFTAARNSNFENWKIGAEIHEFMQNIWSRRAIIDILDTFCFTLAIFNEKEPLIPAKTSHHEAAIVLEKSLHCATWILDNYQKYDSEKAMKDIRFLENSEVKKEFVEKIQKAWSDLEEGNVTVKQDSGLVSEYLKSKHVELNGGDIATEEILSDVKESEGVRSLGDVRAIGAVKSKNPEGVEGSLKLKSEDVKAPDDVDDSDSEDVEFDDTQESDIDSEKTESLLSEVVEKLNELNNNNVEFIPKEADWLDSKLSEALYSSDDDQNNMKIKMDSLKIQNENEQNARTRSSSRASSADSTDQWMDKETREPIRPHELFDWTRSQSKYGALEPERIKEIPPFPPSTRPASSLFSMENEEKKTILNTPDKKKWFDWNGEVTDEEREEMRKKRRAIFSSMLNKPRAAAKKLKPETSEGPKKIKMMDSDEFKAFAAAAFINPEAPEMAENPRLEEIKMAEAVFGPLPPKRAPTPVEKKGPESETGRKKKDPLPKRRTKKDRAPGFGLKDSFATRRRLFGGVGVGERPKFAGFV